MLDANHVRAALKKLSASRVRIFGADEHGFALNPSLTDAEVLAFERCHRVSLPTDYRTFITHVGNGGAGPYYGIFPLGKMDGNAGTMEAWEEGDGFVGVLSEPFPLRDAWNDLTGEPSSELLESDEAEYDRQVEAFEKKYWDSSLVNGAIPICHMGCALRIWLVVAGEEAGHLWRDGRADDTGISPVVLGDGARATFSSWYAEWLEHPPRLTSD